MNGVLTTRDLPEVMLSPVTTAPAPVVTPVLTCEHGPACPSCVLASARALLADDASLSASVYTA